MKTIRLSLRLLAHYSLLSSIFVSATTTSTKWSTPAYHSNSCSTIHRSCNENTTTLLAKTLYCSCSPSCTRFGDCCMDYEYVQEEPSYQCVHPSFTNDFKSYMMIAQCPRNWEDNETRQLCETSTEDESDRLRAMPVSSVYSNATYRNIYCAICHDDLTGLVSWRIQIRCHTRASLRKNISEIFETCFGTEYQYPGWIDDNYLDNHVLRFCNDKIISTCQSSRVPVDHDALVKNCSQYFEPVQTTDGNEIYKNVYCAKCNDIDISTLRCPDLRNLMFDRSYTTYTSDPTLYIGGRNLDLSVLLSIDTRRGTAYTRDPAKCPPDHVYIKWTKAGFRISNEDPTVKDYTCLMIRKSRGNITTVRQGKGRDLDFQTKIDCPKKVLYTNYSLNMSTGIVELTDIGVVLENGSYQILPNSSIVVCLSHSEIDDPFAALKNILSIVCSSISLLGLFLKVVFYYAIPEQRTVPNKSIIMLSVSLFAAQLLFLVGLEETKIFHFCLILASLIHYFFLVAFCWMNVLAYDVYRTFSSITRMKSSKKKFTLYNIYAWFMPLLAVVPSIVFDRFLDIKIIRPGFGDHLCWFANKTALLVFFAAPLAAILASNLFFFSITSFRIYRTTKETKIARRRSTTTPESEDLVLFRLYIKLALIMGLTWILGFVAAYASSIILWCFFIVFNGLQGAFIFLAFTDFRIRSRVVRIRLGLRRLRSDGSSNQHRSSMETKTSDVLFRSKR